MIIDTHAHIGALPPFFDMTTEQVLYSMEKYGIDFSLISDIEAAEYDHQRNPVPAFLQKPQNVILRDTLDAVKKASDKLGALPWLKIGSELPDADFIRTVKENRSLIYGFKLHPFHSLVSTLKQVWNNAKTTGNRSV